MPSPTEYAYNIGDQPIYHLLFLLLILFATQYSFSVALLLALLSAIILLLAHHRMYQPDTAQPNPLLSEKRNPYVIIGRTLEEGPHNSVHVKPDFVREVYVKPDFVREVHVKPDFVREERIDCSWDEVSTYRATASDNTDTRYFRNPKELAGTMPLLKRNGVNATAKKNG